MAGTFALGILATQFLTRPDPDTFGATQQVATSTPQLEPPLVRVTADEPTKGQKPDDPNPATSTLTELLDLSVTEQNVTRSTPVDLLSPSGSEASVLAELQPDAYPTLVPPTAPNALQSAVIALNEAQQKAALEANEAKRAEQRALGLHMRMLKEGALAGVYTVETIEKDGNLHVFYRPGNLERSHTYIETLLREAAQRGEITLPPSRHAKNGDLDLDLMLFNLVQNALVQEGSERAIAAAAEMTRRVFSAAGTQNARLGKAKSYTVQPGDSLALISLKFYGQAGGFTRIFEANRAILSSPDRIRVGQRLIIPG